MGRLKIGPTSQKGNPEAACPVPSSQYWEWGSYKAVFSFGLTVGKRGPLSLRRFPPTNDQLMYLFDFVYFEIYHHAGYSELQPLSLRCLPFNCVVREYFAWRLFLHSLPFSQLSTMFIFLLCLLSLRIYCMLVPSVYYYTKSVLILNLVAHLSFYWPLHLVLIVLYPYESRLDIIVYWIYNIKLSYIYLFYLLYHSLPSKNSVMPCRAAAL